MRLYSKPKNDGAEIGPSPDTPPASADAAKDALAPQDQTGLPAKDVYPDTRKDLGQSDSGDEKVVSRNPGTEARSGLFGRLRQALARTSKGLVDGIADLFTSRKALGTDLVDELETLLLTADVGIDATDRILANLAPKLRRKELADAPAVVAALKTRMLEHLSAVEVPLEIPSTLTSPYVILVVGINGAGKTTTIGKLTQRFKSQGRTVLLAAGDTFRAAAVEQLQVWGERHDIPVVAQTKGGDSASVAFDALDSAHARGMDILIVDTAGRLHTKVGLMDELAKVRRVLSKRDPDAPHEVLLVLDAGTGQNGIVQATQFHEAVGVSGIVLTKLDGTAKGGMIFSISEQLKIPIRFIGIGENADDLREFDAGEFVNAFLNQSTQT